MDGSRENTRVICFPTRGKLLFSAMKQKKGKYLAVASSEILKTCEKLTAELKKAIRFVNQTDDAFLSLKHSTTSRVLSLTSLEILE